MCGQHASLRAMRLTKSERRVIRDTARACYGEDATVLLFGSRLDDRRQGGDIDLLVETNLEPGEAFAAEQRFYARLQRLLGERQIDITSHSRHHARTRLQADAHSHGEPV